MDADSTEKLAKQITIATEAMRKLANRAATPLSDEQAISALAEILMAVALMEKWKSQTLEMGRS